MDSLSELSEIYRHNMKGYFFSFYKKSGIPPPMKLPPPYKGARRSSSDEPEEEEDEEEENAFTEGKLWSIIRSVELLHSEFFFGALT